MGYTTPLFVHLSGRKDVSSFSSRWSCASNDLELTIVALIRSEVDIGEVDLIVNFDCLSSPIRTIQRVGRTGRKREGRVVTLVAEGHEERT